MKIKQRKFGKKRTKPSRGGGNVKEIPFNLNDDQQSEGPRSKRLRIGGDEEAKDARRLIIVLEDCSLEVGKVSEK